MRIDKFLSQLNYCTRSETKTFLKQHELTIDQKRIMLPNFAFDPNKQKVYINQELVFYEDPIHLMLHKPKGYVSAKKDNLYPCVIDLITPPYNRFDFSIAGRLDVDTEGLLILTTDGKFLHEITHPNYHLPKVYEAILDRPFEHKNELLSGVKIYDANQVMFEAKALDVHVEDQKVLITIDEGKFHQVKRMFLSVGYKVIYLKRIKIGKLALNDLELGMIKQIKRSDLYD